MILCMDWPIYFDGREGEKEKEKEREREREREREEKKRTFGDQHKLPPLQVDSLMNWMQSGNHKLATCAQSKVLHPIQCQAADQPSTLTWQEKFMRIPKWDDMHVATFWNGKISAELVDIITESNPIPATKKINCTWSGNWTLESMAIWRAHVSIGSLRITLSPKRTICNKDVQTASSGTCTLVMS